MKSMAILLKAEPLINKLREDFKNRVVQFRKKRNRRPKLAVVLVGDDPASLIYVNKKAKLALEVGMEQEVLRFPPDALPSEVKTAIDRLNADPLTDGILIQRPLPRSYVESQVVRWVNPEKDVDAFHPENVGNMALGLPGFCSCTPQGIMELLTYYKIQLSGKVACVVGRSPIVGRPMANLLLRSNATVIQCHSKTENLSHWTKQADVLIVAAGKSGLIGAAAVKPGAVVIDVGMHRSANGSVHGDVLFSEVAPLVQAITPVPGGVGPMTILMLIANTLNAAETSKY